MKSVAVVALQLKAGVAADLHDRRKRRVEVEGSG